MCEVTINSGHTSGGFCYHPDETEGNPNVNTRGIPEEFADKITTAKEYSDDHLKVLRALNT